MKRVICLLIALVLCLSLAAPVFATEAGFVPSITYKPNPEIVPVEKDGKEYIGIIRDEKGEILDYVEHGCLMITPIAHVWDGLSRCSRKMNRLRQQRRKRRKRRSRFCR